MDPSKMKIVYVITERNGKSFWNRIGIAFVNKDGSINAKLDAVPVSGTLQIRDYNPKEAQPDVRLSRDNGASEAFAQLA